ncbi:MAG: hypothetical protein U0169_03295 [Polyangiaceae bacterium]
MRLYVPRVSFAPLQLSVMLVFLSVSAKANADDATSVDTDNAAPNPSSEASVPPPVLRPTPVPVAPAPPADARAGAFELASLKVLREKGILTDAEYASATKDVIDTAGLRGPEGTTLAVGKWATTIYGFVQASSIYDTTQSFNEQMGNGAVARSGTFVGDHDRLQFSARHSRFGLRVKAPEWHGMRASAQLEMDFLGTQLPVGAGQPYFGSEGAFITNPTLRARHLNFKLETPVVDFLVGQSWALLGWQPVFQPNTVEIQGVPGQVFSRTPQIRLSKTMKFGAVTTELAVAALRSPQRDSGIPDGQAGLRITYEKFTGAHTGSATATGIQPISIAVTGDVRHVRLPEFSAAPKDTRGKNGGTIAVDALVPILPASKGTMGNSLTLVGEFASGYGAAEQYSSLNGGVSFPALPNPSNATPAPTFAQDIDNGIAVYDAKGSLHLVQWTSFFVGAEYYLPGLDGKVWVSGFLSRLESSNAKSYGAPARVRDHSLYVSGAAFADVTPAVRVGLEYSNYQDTYADAQTATNHRFQTSFFYLF